MPLVFGGAPVINVIYTMIVHPPKTAPSLMWFLGLIFASIGAGISIVGLKQDNSGNIYAATEQGIYVSTDDGLHWQTHLLDGIAINKLTFLDGQILAATADGMYLIESPDTTPVHPRIRGRRSG